MAAVEEKIEVRAQAKWVRTAPRKAQLVATEIRGRTVPEARVILSFMTRAAAKDVARVLDSAVANAEANHGLFGDDLYISAADVGTGPTLKRWRARARGRVGRIKKRTCHITIRLEPVDGALMVDDGGAAAERAARARSPEVEAAPTAEPESEAAPDSGALEELGTEEADGGPAEPDTPAEEEPKPRPRTPRTKAGDKPADPEAKPTRGRKPKAEATGEEAPVAQPKPTRPRSSTPKAEGSAGREQKPRRATRARKKTDEPHEESEE
jgi:large subunit ribosomal protein L22